MPHGGARLKPVSYTHLVDVVGLGFGVDDNKPAFACYIQMPVIVIVHIPYKELSLSLIHI